MLALYSGTSSRTYSRIMELFLSREAYAWELDEAEE
jgi:hypothetical protein